MTQRRITLKPDAYRALQAEALIRSISLSDMLDEIVMSHISKEAKAILDQLTLSTSIHVAKTTKVKSYSKPLIQSATKNRRHISNDPVAMAKLHQLWTGTDMNQTQIARELGSPESTIRTLIRRQLTNGELPPRRESGSVSEPEV